MDKKDEGKQREQKKKKNWYCYKTNNRHVIKKRLLPRK